MQLTVVDNSTLTAVQRLSGTAPTRSSKNTEGDIAALETFVQALLFSDLVCSIDDYKPQFREIRAKEFPYVRLLQPFEVDMEGVADEVRQEVKQLNLAIGDGKLKGELGRVMSSLGLLTHCAWEMSSSVFWLQLYLVSNPEIDVDKATMHQVMAGLEDMASAADFFWSKEIVIESTTNQGEGPTRGLAALVAAVSWLIARVRYYEAGAQMLQASLSLHPVRHGYLAHRLQLEGAIGDHIKGRLVHMLAEQTMNAVANEVSLEPGFLQVPVPFFAGWLATQREDIPAMLQLALEIKMEPDFLSFRRQLAEISNDRIGVDRAKALQSDVRQVVERFFGKYSIPAMGATGTALVTLGETITKTPVNPLLQLVRTILPNACALTTGVGLFRHIAHDLNQIPRWGDVRDKLGRSVRLDEKPVFEPKALDPDDLNRVLRYRKPM